MIILSLAQVVAPMMRWNPEVSLGTVLAILAIVGTGIGSYYAMRGRIDRVEQRLATGDQRFDLVETQVRESVKLASDEWRAALQQTVDMWKESRAADRDRQLRMEDQMMSMTKEIHRMIGIIDRRMDTGATLKV